MKFLSQFEGDSPRKILRLLTYNPRLQSTVLSEPSRMQAKIVHFIPPPTFATLGDFNTFPIELLNEILWYSDLCTIFMFSLLNRQARTIAHALPPYKHLLHHAPRALVALIRTGGGSHFTVDEVFHALCSPACCICGNFGAFLWIPECIRCCFVCFRKAPRLMPMGRTRAKAVFGLSKKALAKVPIMVTLPGTYSLFQKDYIRPRYLLSRVRAHQVAIITHGGKQGLAKYMESKMSHVEAMSELQPPDTMFEHVTRFMATIPFPYYDPTSGVTHIGLSCQGCKYACITTIIVSSEQCIALGDRRDQMYTDMGFFEHLEHCQEAQDLWRNKWDGDDRSW